MHVGVIATGAAPVPRHSWRRGFRPVVSSVAEPGQRSARLNKLTTGPEISPGASEQQVVRVRACVGSLGQLQAQSQSQPKSERSRVPPASRTATLRRSWAPRSDSNISILLARPSRPRSHHLHISLRLVHQYQHIFILHNGSYQADRPQVHRWQATVPPRSCSLAAAPPRSTACPSSASLSRAPWSVCPPTSWVSAPAYAIPRLFELTGLTKDDIDIFEINEAFASQALFSVEHLGIDKKKVNPVGGAIAMGHPLGATGARQIATGLAEAKRQGGKKLIVTSMCVGTGMGCASLIVSA
ncbi:hypothetical protein L1887_55969 [Cichorium endivia]|nr:hypothetical protein L1887_55969 [Cichorium endivia]